MTPGATRPFTAATLLRAAVLAGLALAGLAPRAASAQEPVYRRLLGLPVVGDTVGYPVSVSADLHTGEVFVCDSRRNRILIFDADGLFSFQIPGGDRFSAPRDVAVDPEGYIFVVANRAGRRALLELDFDGLFRREIVLGTGPPNQAPDYTSVALSPSGDRLYVLDERNLVLWISDRSGEVLQRVDVAAGVAEQARDDLMLGHVDVYGDRVLVPIASLGEIRILDLDGRLVRSTGRKGTAPCTIARPVAAALSNDGELVVVDQQRMVVLRWNPEANRCLGDYLSIGAAPGLLYFPMDLALDREGRIFIPQGFESRVQMYDGMTPAASPPR